MCTVALYANISGETRKKELHVKNIKRVNTYNPWGGGGGPKRDKKKKKGGGKGIWEKGRKKKEK